METARKRKGIKGKLIMSLYKTSPAKETTSVEISNKVINPNRSSPTPASVGFLDKHDFSLPGGKQRGYSSNKYDGNGGGEVTSLYFDGGFVDHNVDKKAASYISHVQERFSLERVNSERRKYQEMQAGSVY